MTIFKQNKLICQTIINLYEDIFMCNYFGHTF